MLQAMLGEQIEIMGDEYGRHGATESIMETAQRRCFRARE
jgi:hypothetical protein